MPNPALLDPLYLSTLVASRLCHDLISPIGAIGNGIELMVMESAGPSGQELALILLNCAQFFCSAFRSSQSLRSFVRYLLRAIARTGAVSLSHGHRPQGASEATGHMAPS